MTETGAVEEATKTAHLTRISDTFPREEVRVAKYRDRNEPHDLARFHSAQSSRIRPIVQLAAGPSGASGR